MYIYYNNNPVGNIRAGDCVIRAISLITGDSWEKIYTDLSSEGFAYGRNRGAYGESSRRAYSQKV